MLEQMQQDIAILKSKDTSNNRASGSSQGQNLGSSNLVIQLGTTPTIPNVVATTGPASTATTGTSASSTFITEERSQEVLKCEAKRSNKMVSVVKFQSPYSNQVLFKPYPRDYIKPKLRKFDGRKGNPR